MTSSKLLLHPVRLRIVEAFIGGRQLTTADLRSELDDIPAGSLYRHIALLADAGVLDVIAERRVRGAVERTYVLHPGPQDLTADVLKLAPEEHRRAFFAYIAAIIADFDRCVSQPDVDLLREKVTYRAAAIWLDDEELEAAVKGFVEFVTPLIRNQPRAGRKRYILRTILLPGTDSTDPS